MYDPKNAQIQKGISECEVELAKIADSKRRVARLSDDFGIHLTLFCTFHESNTFDLLQIVYYV